MDEGREDGREDAGVAAAGLLEKVVDFYQKALLRGRRGLNFLRRLGLEESHLVETCGIGYCDGRLLKVLPAADPRREALGALGLVAGVDEGLTEVLLGQVVLPVLDEEGGLLALWGIHTRTRRETLIPADACPLWNIKAAGLYPEVLLCARILDALSLTRAGFPNVLGLAPGQLGSVHIQRLKALGVRRVALLGESDQVSRVRPRLDVLELACIVLHRGEDLNGRLVEQGERALVEFVESRVKSAPVQLPAANEDVGPLTSIEDGLRVAYGNRTYILKAIEKRARRLRATLRAEFRGRLHVDTLDLYNARARKTLAQDLCRLYEESAAVIETDIGRIIKACEAYEPGAPEETTAPVVLTPEDRAEAEAFGRDPDLLGRIVADYEACGLIGERSNKLISYLAAVSRKLADPLSILILSSSGAGKSALQDATLAFCPPEDVVKLTRLTGKALFYKGRTSLKHRVLALEEGAGARDAVYAIRNLISAKALVIEAAVKDFTTGRLTTMENRVEGPTAVFITTTDPDVDPETRSRFVVLSVDESREQTRAILEQQRRQQTLPAVRRRESRARIQKRHWNFQRLLAPLSVVNPHADRVRFGDDRLQSRRDHPKYLNLIRALAFLRQMGRPVKTAAGKDGQTVRYIEVEPEDVETVERLVHEAMGHGVDDLNGVSRALLGQIDRMVAGRARTLGIEPADVEFTRRQIREFSGWSHVRVHRYMGQLVDLEYLVCQRGRNGTRFTYRLAARPPAVVVAPAPEVRP